jgi:hypothetical protein
MSRCEDAVFDCVGFFTELPSAEEFRANVVLFVLVLMLDELSLEDNDRGRDRECDADVDDADSDLLLT